MKLSCWAKKQGITYTTAWRWFKRGKMPVPAFKTATGTILVEEQATPGPARLDAWVYCRVSSHAKKDDLERQALRVMAFCQARGWVVQRVEKEIASGMNDKRPKLMRLLALKPTRIVVEHKDRLTRFGFNYFEQLLPMLNCELVVINRDEIAHDDLMKDLVAVITSFCCRLYGLRRGRYKAAQIQRDVTCNEPAKSL